MEVCVDSLESAIAAYKGGANRIELCSSLNEGGLTPSLGLYQCIRRKIPNFKIFCMIRPRSGDFLYNDYEIDCMEEDFKQFIELEADGLVFGGLTAEGLVDEQLMKQFLNLIPIQSSIQTTFHRAFDMCADWKASLDIIKRLGFSRLLTSGQDKTAFEGRKRICEYVDYLKNESLIVLPGAGITADNLEVILRETKCKEFHASCRSSRSSKMIYRNTKISMGTPGVDEYEEKFTDIYRVKNLAEGFNNIFRI
jgi:copper homeostasis protein